MDQSIVFIDGTAAPTGIIYADEVFDYECWRVEVTQEPTVVVVRAEGIDGKNFSPWSEEFVIQKEEFNKNSYVMVIESRKRGIVRFFKCSEIESI